MAQVYTNASIHYFYLLPHAKPSLCLNLSLVGYGSSKLLSVIEPFGLPSLNPEASQHRNELLKDQSTERGSKEKIKKTQHRLGLG